MTGPSPSDGSARRVVDSHERTLDPQRRRELGAHYTPGPLARRLVDLAAGTLGRRPRLVCDPSCGAGSFLLAAADHLADGGVSPRDVLARHVVGFDIDPRSVAAARTALRRWAVDSGAVEPPEPRVLVADALESTLPAELTRESPDLVVGNPPFASPLTAGVESAAERAYTDVSAAHLLSALQLVRPGGVVTMLQPQSVLGARDSGVVRRAVSEQATLVAVWLTDDQPFEAAVQVCAPVLLRRGGTGDPVAAGRGAVELWWREDAPRTVHLPNSGGAGDADAVSWSPLLAVATGVPWVPEPDGGAPMLGEVALCTAGFRDEFYALADVAVDTSAEVPDDHPPGQMRLVTSGMIDPGHLGWGERARRLCGRSVWRPAVYLPEVDHRSAAVGRWARNRAVPKVLVASQTRIIEAVADPIGDCLPVTPVVSVEPSTTAIGVEVLSAALSAPSNSARLAWGSAGTGRSTHSLRISAGALAKLPVAATPGARDAAVSAWRDLVDGFERSDIRALRVAAAGLDASIGSHDPDVVDWWVRRLPRHLSLVDR